MVAQQLAKLPGVKTCASSTLAPAGLCMKVTYNRTYKSFNLQKDEPVIKLSKHDEWEKFKEYAADMEITPPSDSEVELEEDDLGD
jgi:hypothetical protein